MTNHQWCYQTSSVALWQIISGVIRHLQWLYDKSSVVLSHIISGAIKHHHWLYDKSSVVLSHIISGVILKHFLPLSAWIFTWKKKVILDVIYKSNKNPTSAVRIAFHLPSVTNIKPFGRLSRSSVHRTSFHNNPSTRRELRVSKPASWQPHLAEQLAIFLLAQFCHRLSVPLLPTQEGRNYTNTRTVKSKLWYFFW